MTTSIFSENFTFVIMIACFSVLVAEVSGIIQWIKWKFAIETLKPLDCEKCLAFWLGLIWFSIHVPHPIYAVLYAATTSITAVYILKLIR